MRKLLCLLPMCFVMLFAAAQSFQPGYIVKRAGDTSLGYIESLPTYQLAQSVHFKNNLSEKEFANFTIKELSAFGLEDGRFFRELQYKDAIHDYETKIEFAKVVILGYYDLYAIPREGQYYFYLKSEQDTGYFLFPNRIIDYTNYPGNYKNILSFLSRDCANGIGNLETLFYSEKDIAKIVTALNKCVAPNTVSNINVQKARLKFQGTLGAGGMYYGHESNQFNFHGALRVMFPEMNRKFSLNLGYNYYKQHRLVSTGTLGSHKAETIEITKQSSISFFTNYYFLLGRVRPYILAGGSFTLWEGDQYLRIYNSAYNNGGIQENHTDHYSTTRPVFLGALGVDVFLYKGLGVKAEIKYEWNVQYPTIGVFYLFNK